MASSSAKFGHIQINPYFIFFNRKRVFAMVVHNPICEGRKCLCSPDISIILIISHSDLKLNNV